MADIEPSALPTAARHPARPPMMGKDLTTGPVARELILFALPTLGSNILQSLNGTLNAVWVGHMLGENALAATTNGNNVMFLAMAAVFGLGMATTILVGQSYGRRDIDMVRRAVGSSAGLFLILSVIVALIGWFGAPALLNLLATPPEAMDLARAYFQIIFLAMPPVFMMTLIMMSLRGTGDAITPLIWMAVAVFLDSGLNPLLIGGYLGLPRMGIAGAALATVIANYVAFAGVLIQIYAGDLTIRLRGAELAYLRPDPALLGTIFLKGIPMSIQIFVVAGASLVMIGLINREGVITTAAYSVTMQLWTYIQMPAMAVGAAVSSMVAQNIGAGKWDRVTRVTRDGIMISLLTTSFFVALLFFIDRCALNAFLPSTSPAMTIAQHIQRLATWSFIMFGVTFVLLGTMRANGAVWVPVAILAIGLLPFRIGVALGLHGWLKADALWLSFPISSAVTLLLSAIFYQSGRWKRAHMVPTTSAAH